MKINKKIVIILILILVGTMILPFHANAEEKKGVLVRWWQRIVARVRAMRGPKEPEAASKVQTVLPKDAPAKAEDISLPEEVEDAEAEEPATEKAPGMKPEPSPEKPEENIQGEPVEVVTYDAEEEQQVQEEAIEDIPAEDEDLDAFPDEPFSDEEGMDEEEITEREEKEIPYTKEEMIDIIKRRVEAFPQIAFLIPGFRASGDEGGEVVLLYKKVDEIGSSEVSLKDLDKETLHRLFVRVNNEATRLNTERIVRQLQQQDNLQRIQMQQQQLQNQQSLINQEIHKRQMQQQQLQQQQLEQQQRQQLQQQQQQR